MKRQKWFFIRGLVRESGHWAGFLERFAEAFPEREVVPLDLPGNGMRFREKSPITIQETSEFVRSEYLKVKGEDNYLFALSLAAMAGIQWMKDHPLDFQGAVLVNTSLRGLSPLHHRLRPSNYSTILKLMAGASVAERERAILEMTSQRPEKFAALEREWIEIQQKRPVSRKNSLRQLLAAIRFRPPQEKPTARVLILNGEKDSLVNPRCSLALANFWGAEIAIHPRAGHDLTLDEPEWVLEQLAKF